jgi:tryptophan synthase beta chain
MGLFLCFPLKELFCYIFKKGIKMKHSLKIDGPCKIYLQEHEMPEAWYNVRADMKKKPAPLLNPKTLKPATPEDLRPVFCDELIRQELDENTAYFPIPEDIRTFYKMYRPSPLVRAYFLEQALGTPAHIYYKFEGNQKVNERAMIC